MVFIEVATPRVLKIKHAEHVVLVDERDAELGASLGIDLDVAMIFADIRHENGAPLGDCRSDQAASARDIVFDLDVLLEPHRKTVNQLFLFLVEQKDGEHLVIDQLDHQVSNALEQLVQNQDRSEL